MKFYFLVYFHLTPINCTYEIIHITSKDSRPKLTSLYSLLISFQTHIFHSLIKCPRKNLLRISMTRRRTQRTSLPRWGFLSTSTPMGVIQMGIHSVGRIMEDRTELCMKCRFPTGRKEFQLTSDLVLPFIFCQNYVGWIWWPCFPQEPSARTSVREERDAAHARACQSSDSA